MTTLTCISPIDGRPYAVRETAEFDEIERRLQTASSAQKDWARRPVGERAEIVMKAIDALEAMNDEVVVEIAHMMGRPVRYGGEIGGVRERASYMASIAETALAPDLIEEGSSYHRFIAREAGRHRVCCGAVELSIPDGGEHDRTGADRR